MQYRCKTIALTKLIATPKGFVQPLCAFCKTGDCTNPIENRKVSVLGIMKQIKVFSRTEESNIVISCEGFSR